MAEYEGVLEFHSETGTEGGAWAFQDAQFMNLPAPDQHACTRCGRVWDRGVDSEPPAPSFSYYRPEYEEDGKRYVGGFFGSDTYDPGGDEHGDRFVHHMNETSRQCAEQGHAGWRPMYPDGMRSYEGLHILSDGDVLTVYSPESLQAEGMAEVLWEGTVSLPPRQDPYAPGAYVAGGGYAAHRRPPEGTDEGWFFAGLRAKLTVHAARGTS